MNKERFFLFLSLALILLLLLMTEFQKPTISGEIERISGNFPVRINLLNQTTQIIVFQDKLNLEKGNIINVYGMKQNEQEIIANRIECLNC
jgi:hypothetical protein